MADVPDPLMPKPPVGARRTQPHSTSAVQQTQLDVLSTRGYTRITLVAMPSPALSTAEPAEPPAVRSGHPAARPAGPAFRHPALLVGTVLLGLGLGSALQPPDAGSLAGALPGGGGGWRRGEALVATAPPSITGQLPSAPGGQRGAGGRDAVPAVEVAGETSVAAPATTDPSGPTGGAAPEATATAAPELRPITRLSIPRISLETDVVPAKIVTAASGTTWDVPPFVVGHAEQTVGAGQPGNAVLLGHVTSPNAGSVFRDLGRLRPGDTVEVGSNGERFTYRVSAVRVVALDDLSPLDDTEAPAITMITCTGAWLPQLGQFAKRLVVRAELVSPDQAPSPATG